MVSRSGKLSGAAARTGRLKKENIDNYRKKEVFGMIKTVILRVMGRKQRDL